MKSEVPPEVLDVGEPLEARQADESLRFIAFQLFLGQGQPVLNRHRRLALLPPFRWVATIQILHSENTA